MKKQKSKKRRDWLIAYLYIFFLYITLPIVPRIWEKFVSKAGNFAEYLAFVILAVLVVFAAFYLIATHKGASSFIWLAILASCYAFGLSKLKLPIERMHFIEYGLLSILVFRALRHNIKDKFIYLWSGIAVFCVGLIDEGIQYVLPNRVLDNRDVIVNSLAGILGLLIIGLVFKPKLESMR